MSWFRSERSSAILLLGAALAGLALANLPIAPAVHAIVGHPLELPALGLRLSVGDWVSDGLLSLFFFVVAVELKQEFVSGQLSSVRRALVPALAALGGVAAPAAIFALLTLGTPYQHGWPIPTATDVAFALGVLALFGRGLPPRIRVFLLALAVLDDLIAIVIIAVAFRHGLDLRFLVLAAVAVVGVRLIGRRPGRGNAAVRAVSVALTLGLSLAAWYFGYRSGVHATIAAVAVGLALPLASARRAAQALEPVVNLVALPVFAFVAAAVTVPPPTSLASSSVFWAAVVALPLGKLLGISLVGGVAGRIFRDPRPTARGQTLTADELVSVGALGGIGFTVALLMTDLAFGKTAEIADQGTLGVLVGSGISIVVSALLLGLLRVRGRISSTMRSSSLPPAAGSRPRRSR